MATLTRCYRGIPEQIDSGMAGWRIQFEFDRDVIEQLKRTIPYEKREWLPDAKEWWVSCESEECLRQLFSNFGLFADQEALPGFEEGQCTIT